MKYLLLVFVSMKALFVNAQVDTCIVSSTKHIINSIYLNEVREHWVSLPLHYDQNKKYNVLYVFDAEWRFDLLKAITFDLGANKEIPNHIVVGIPHIEMDNKRGIDLTFTESLVEFDGDIVDSNWYNKTNSGGAEKFYNYLVSELIPSINNYYSTTRNNVLVGHSLGGYFNTYILPFDTNFNSYLTFDPSIWYENGETIKRIERLLGKDKKASFFITYQPEPPFHSAKIEELINVLKAYPNIDLSYKKYSNHTHNSLYMDSFIEGIRFIYNK